MDRRVDTKNGVNQLTLESDTKPNTDAFPTSGDLVVWSPAKDSILKYSKDPPALIACVTYPDAMFGVANLAFQYYGCYWQREDNGIEGPPLIDFHKL